MALAVVLVVLASALSSAGASQTIKGNWQHREDFVETPRELLLSEERHELVFAVRQQNLAKLEQVLFEVSSPDSPRYGQHLSHKEVHELTSNRVATEAVHSFCKEQGLRVEQTSEYGEYVTASAPIATVNAVFSTSFVNMKHATFGSILRSPSYSLPEALASHVQHIFNLVELPARQAPAMEYTIVPEEEVTSKEGDDYACHSVMAPQCWNYYYNQTSNDAKGQSQLVFGQKGAVMAPGDLGVFAASSNVPAATFVCPAGGCSGDTDCQGYDPQMKGNGHFCVEANLDTQWISAVGQGATNTFYQVQNLETPFLHFVMYISSLKSPPGSVSISYGSYEYEMDHSVMDQFTTEAMKLGAQGVTILAATGDDGVAGYKARNDTSKCKYTVSFPSTCPFVTAVGGTQNAENDPEDHEVHTLKEWAANGVEQQGPFFKTTTNGGFSNYFPAPDYQKDHIATYFKTPEAARAKKGYSTTGRGTPDIASNSINFQIYITSFRCLVSGTSGAAPSLAGMISVINAQRAKANKGKLGFLNPLLYANPTAMNEISHGWNNCTAVPAFCCSEGFTSAAGWDPLVGLGSPSYARLLKASGMSEMTTEIQI